MTSSAVDAEMTRSRATTATTFCEAVEDSTPAAAAAARTPAFQSSPLGVADDPARGGAGTGLSQSSTPPNRAVLYRRVSARRAAPSLSAALVKPLGKEPLLLDVAKCSSAPAYPPSSARSG